MHTGNPSRERRNQQAINIAKEGLEQHTESVELIILGVLLAEQGEFAQADWPIKKH